MWDLKLDTRRLADGFSTSVLWDRPNILWEKADDWWNDNYVTDSNTAAFLSATGIIDPNKQNYVNNLVIALKNQGLWNKMKAIYPFVSEQRNLLNNTDTFSGWTPEGGTLTGGFTDPLGGNTAYKFINNSSNGLWANQGFTETSTTYTQSIWVKSVSGANVNFILSSGNGPTGQVNLTATGTWQRVSNTNTFDVGGSFYIRNVLDAAGIYVWHPQVELGNLTDYQVTINAQEQFAAAYKYNLKDPQNTDAAFRLKIFGTWTFTPTGAKPNGTNAYMDTCLNPSTNYGGILDSHLSYYSRTDNNSGFDMGGETPTFDLIVRLSNVFWSRFGNDATVTNTNGLGYYISSSKSTFGIKGYKNGVNISSGSYSNSLFNGNIYLGAVNAAGTASSFGSKQSAFSSIGTGLSDAEAATLYTIVQQFQTSMARQV